MASFSLTEEQQILKDQVHDLAQSLMREDDKHRKYEKSGQVDGDLLSTYKEMQLALVEIPESLGGVGMGALGAAIVQEELAWGDCGATLGLPGPGLLTSAVLALGSEAQQKSLLSPFVEDAGRRGAVAFVEPASVYDPAEFTTTWTKKGAGYVLNGKKALVLNGGIADTTIVFAAEAGKSASWENLKAFVVQKSNGGLKVGARRATMGLRAATFADIELAGCEVAEGDVLAGSVRENFQKFYAMASAGYSGRNTGMARAAIEAAKEFCVSRVAFGKPIAQHQGLSWYLVDMMMGTEVARLAAWQNAYQYDNDMLDPTIAHRACMVTDQQALVTCDHAIQALGGAGFIQDFPVEKWSRDARTHTMLGHVHPVSKTALGAMLMNSTRPV